MRCCEFSYYYYLQMEMQHEQSNGYVLQWFRAYKTAGRGGLPKSCQNYQPVCSRESLIAMQTMSSIFALAGIAGTSFTLALSGTLMPGPLLTVTVAEVARRGVWAGPLVITGHALLEFVLLLAILMGLGSYLETPAVIGIISLLGGIVLFVMGVDMIRRASTLTLQQEQIQKKQVATNHPVILGIFGSLANPYLIIWWVTIGLGYLATIKQFGVAGIVAFFVGHMVADYGWYILIALGVSRGKSIAPDKGYHILIRCCGLFLVGFGCWFLTSAYGYLGKI